MANHVRQQIREYFESLPIVSHLIKYKNPKSGKEFTLLLQGASDFFQILRCVQPLLSHRKNRTQSQPHERR